MRRSRGEGAAIAAGQRARRAGQGGTVDDRKIFYNTVQELIDGRFTVTIYCHNPRCHRRAELDLKARREKLGPMGSHSALTPDIWHPPQQEQVRKHAAQFTVCKGFAR